MLISQEIVQIWQSVNPRLPLLKMKSIEKKLHDLLIQVKDINQKHAKAPAKQKLDLTTRRNFWYICLSVYAGSYAMQWQKINCDVEDNQEEHIFCACNPSCKVSLEERACLKDQRLKKEPKRLYQMAFVKRTAIKRFKRLSQTLIQPVKDNTIAPKTLPQSSTDTSLLKSEAKVREKYYFKLK